MATSSIVVGSGIVGLAMARALAAVGRKVLVLERHGKPVGASIRNFGMVWPIGQSAGLLYERALLSRSIWKEVCAEARLWHDASGSMHLAYSDLEMEVLESFHASVKAQRPYELMGSSKALSYSPAVVSSGLKGALYSPDEMIVDPPLSLETLPSYLSEKFGVEFRFNLPVDRVETGKAFSGSEIFEADDIYVCTGPDFEFLFPELFREIPMTRCKLQMMRIGAQPNDWKLGPSLCGGLSLVHYKGFHSAGDVLARLRSSYEETMPAYMEMGIHVMVSQNSKGELIVGDSHEYGRTHDPFLREDVNRLILDYLKTFARFPDQTVTHRWYGIYPKMTDGSTELVMEALPGVTVVNGLGGAGMTLSFGLASQIVAGTYA